MIKTNIKATGIELTDDIHNYLDKKIVSLEKFIDPKDESVICEIEVGKTTGHHKGGEDVYRAEFNLRLAGKFLRSVTKADNLYAAIDETKDEMVRQLKQARTKKITLFRRGAGKVKNMLKGLKW